jgi:gluconokinase
MRIVALLPPPDILAERLGHRRGHFMPGSLLASQLATLEVPGDDEASLIIHGDRPVAEVVATARAWLQR